MSMSKRVIAALGFLAVGSVQAETRTWVGSGNWSTAANWSGGAAPGADDDVVFDATSVASATVDAAFGGSVKSITVGASYTGTNTQNRTLAVSGDCALSGGVWRYTAGTAAGLTVGGNMTVDAVVQCQRSSTTGNGEGRTFTVGGDLSVGAGGFIDAAGMGFNLNDGPGKPPGIQGAGGHGGVGGNWDNTGGGVGGGTAYGSVTNPASLGSGGRGTGSLGGGAVRFVVAGSAVIDGHINANAAIITAAVSGSGAGGAIFISAGGTIAGSGTLNARGGYVTNMTYTSQTPYSTGAGGRIALHAGAITLPLGNISAASRWSGAYGKAGAAGTIYLRTAAEPLGTLVIDAGNVATSAGTWAKPTTLFGPLVTDLPTGNVLIRNLGDLHLPSGVTLNVGGWWTNSAVFTASDGSAVVFDTAVPATIFGTNSFYNLSCEIPGKSLTVTAGHVVTVRNLLTLKGAESDRLTLRPSSDAYWYLTVQNAALPHEVRQVDVARSHAGSGATVAAFDSLDSGNNVNWAFAEEGQTNTWLGVSGTGWATMANWSLGRLPVPADTVIIPDTANDPVLDFNKALLNLVIETGGLLRLAGKNLLVTSDLTVNGTLTATAAERVEVWGDVDFTGGLFQNASATLLLSGPAAQTVTSGSLAGFNRLELANTVGALTFTDQVRATNVVAVGATADFEGGLACVQTVGFQGGEVSFGGPVTAPMLTNSAAALSFADTVTVGTFRSRDADLTFGAAVACGEFRNDGADTLTFAPGAAVTVGSLWLNGTDAAPVLLRSGTPGSRWMLNVTRAAGVSRADVQDSDASGGLTVEPVLSVDSGNSLNWNFATTAAWKRWTGTASTDFMNAGNWAPSGVPVAASLVLIDGYFANAPRLLPASTVTVARLTIGGHQTTTLTADGGLTVSQDLSVWPNGVLTHTAHATTATTPQYKLDIAVTGNLFVAGRIDVTGRGFTAGKGPGAGTANQGGGGHGGIGGDWNSQVGPGKCYGSITTPELPGSGGASGPGGGAIRLRVEGRTAVDGVIAANGLDLSGSAAGSGGSIWLTTGTIDGTGLISADGGRGGYYYVDGPGYAHGGGGRVAVYLENGEDFGSVDIRAISKRGYAAANHRGGGAGSVYLRKASEANGVCIYSNQGLLNVRHSVIDDAVTGCDVGGFVLRGATTSLTLSNQTLTVRGDWTNAAAFTAATNGTVAFAGAGTSAVIGATAFGGLQCVTPGKTLAFEAGKTFTVSGLLKLRDAAVRSTAEGVRAKLTLHAVTGTQDIRSVSVRDSDASAGQKLIANPNSTDLGNNLNWEFISSPGTLLLLR